MFGKSSIRLFRIRGIDVFLHWSWFIVAAVEIGSRRSAYTSPAWNVLEYVALFVIVLLHEFGHALACRQVGGQANRILLWPLGGVALVNPPERPKAMLWSIAAGPLVNVILVGVLWGASATGDVLNLWAVIPDVHQLLHALSLINAGLLIFNLLPIYPLDGGQILRSLLWFVMGRARSLMAASVFGFFGVAGLALLAVEFGSVWLALLGAFIALNCWNGFRIARTLVRMESAPRRQNYRCPPCHSNPRQGSFWRCHKCTAIFDMFATPGTCPACGTQFEMTRCLECSALNALASWKEASPMITEPMGTELEFPGIKPLAEPLYNVKNWMRLVGVLTISAGVLFSLTVIGIVVGWIPILAGIALFQSASQAEEAVISGKAGNLTGALDKLGFYFKMSALIRLVFFVLLFLAIVAVIAIVSITRSQQPKNEANAIANIEKINAAQVKYMMSARKYGSLQDLVSAGLVDSHMLDQTMGYRLQIETQKDNYIAMASALVPSGRYDYYSFSDACCAVFRRFQEGATGPVGGTSEIAYCRAGSSTFKMFCTTMA